jgi:hypothetical protein
MLECPRNSHKVKCERKPCLDSFVLLGKHSSNDGSGRNSGAVGSTVCLFFLGFDGSAIDWSVTEATLGIKQARLAFLSCMS